MKYRGWCDVQDNKGVWRLGHYTVSPDGFRLVHLDGWSNKYDTMHCPHSKNIDLPRKYTKGLTTQMPNPLREAQDYSQALKNMHNQLKLLLNSLPETLEVEEIVTFFRIQLLIMIDSILTLPFDFADIHMGLAVNKFFFDIVNLVVKVLQRCSVFLQLTDNPNAKALENACYELFIMLRAVFGLNPRYNKFFTNSENMFIKKEAIIESFLKSDQGGLLTVNTYIRNIIAHSQLTFQNFQTHRQLLTLVMEMYEGRMLPQDQNSRLGLLVDNLANYLKFACKNEEVNMYLTTTPEGKYILNMLENMYIKLKPTKKFSIEAIVGDGSKKKRKGSEDQKEATMSIIESSKIFDVAPKKEGFKKKEKVQMVESLSPANLPILQKNNPQISKLEERISKLQAAQNKQRDVLADFLKQHTASRPQSQILAPASTPTMEFDFNELSFLSTVQFHLANNEVQQASRLINWRKKILQLSTIVGCDIAMAVAKNTQDKLQVTTKDILATNIAYVKKTYSL